MAEEVQGQEVVTQPALQPSNEMNEFQAVDHIEAMLEKQEAPVDRDEETGRFKSKGEQKPEEKQEEKQEPEAQEEEAAPEETPQQEKRRLKLKYKGEELEKDEEEVISLAQQGFDYTQKSQALAKEREEIQAKVKAEVAARQQEYEKGLESLRKTVEKMMGVEDVDLNKLALEDPARAQQEFFKRLQFQQTMQSITAEQEKIVQQRQAEYREAMKKQATEAVEMLETKIPGWNNDIYGKVLKGAVKEYGFKQQEVNAITDYRAIEVLHDAMKYRELMQAKPKTVDKKVAAVPKVQKPGTAEKPDQRAQKVDEKRQRLHKTGNRDDAVALVEEMLADKGW